MSMLLRFCEFLRGESGAITVDYTVLGAAAVGMAMSAAAVLTGAVENLTQRVDSELRTRQLSDDFVSFYSAHFEPLYEIGAANEDGAYEAFTSADTMMNQDIIDAIYLGVLKAQEGTLSNAAMTELFALASVAYQRNILDDAFLEEYFGIE